MSNQTVKFLSQTLFQFAEDEIADIPWSIQPNTPSMSQEDLKTTMNTSTGLQRSRTWYLTYSNFNFKDLPSNITGIQLDLRSRRRGRVMDETVCLSYDDQLISDNKTQYISDDLQHLYINDTMTYGGPGDLWNIQGFDFNSIVNNPLFGITLRFQSHPSYPHRDPVIVDSVLVSFYY